MSWSPVWCQRLVRTGSSDGGATVGDKGLKRHWSRLLWVTGDHDIRRGGIFYVSGEQVLLCVLKIDLD